MKKLKSNQRKKAQNFSSKAKTKRNMCVNPDFAIRHPQMMTVRELNNLISFFVYRNRAITSNYQAIRVETRLFLPQIK